ncbi:hemolysin III family protein (plasmid) [Fulvitalea axinellae]|uniref:Hemolysin III family protein n=1 Tax=Fulvitalea axinellae TaxID=1182444 RepID=A0AAU9CX87_9BACT|nr:hemolysin III family protein [Fulvitalea axinellae]
MKEVRPYTENEEIANGLTHALGIVLGIVGTVALCLKSSSGVEWVAALVYGVSLVALYSASTTYHLVKPPKRKAIFKKFDHAGIYVLIAGTYTPFLLLNIDSGRGLIVLGVLWLSALAGILYKFFFIHKMKKFSTVLYLLMGWVPAITFPTLYEVVGPDGVFWIVAGGVLYSSGVIFYADKVRPYRHAIWHVFVLMASIAHFIAIYAYSFPNSVR